MESWLARIHNAGLSWKIRNPPADQTEIAALEAFVGSSLPADYLTFLQEANGGILLYKDHWYVRLWKAGDIPTWSTGYSIPKFMPEAVQIGDFGSDDGLVFDLRNKLIQPQYPLGAIDLISLHWDGFIHLASDFTTFLLNPKETEAH